MKPALRIITAPEPVGARFKARLAVRGYHVAYRGAKTPCPGCGRHNWDVGRFSAECGFCGCAVPFQGELA